MFDFVLIANIAAGIVLAVVVLFALQLAFACLLAMLGRGAEYVQRRRWMSARW